MDEKSNNGPQPTLGNVEAPDPCPVSCLIIRKKIFRKFAKTLAPSFKKYTRLFSIISQRASCKGGIVTSSR